MRDLEYFVHNRFIGTVIQCELLNRNDLLTIDSSESLHGASSTTCKFPFQLGSFSHASNVMCRETQREVCEFLKVHFYFFWSGFQET